jgi:hypothetical protein
VRVTISQRKLDSRTQAAASVFNAFLKLIIPIDDMVRRSGTCREVPGTPPPHNSHACTPGPYECCHLQGRYSGRISGSCIFYRHPKRCVIILMSWLWTFRSNSIFCCYSGGDKPACIDEAALHGQEAGFEGQIRVCALASLACPDVRCVHSSACCKPDPQDVDDIGPRQPHQEE